MTGASLNGSQSESSGGRRDAGVTIKNLTRHSHAPRSLFVAIAESTLPLWDLSLVFVGPTRARTLNKKLRGKTYTPNVLSYALGQKSGEIIICLSVARKQASDYGMSERDYILYLFIHGVLHLKGWVHSDTMERCERTLLAKFAKNVARPLPYETTHRNRHRHRHVPSKDSRRRGTLR